MNGLKFCSYSILGLPPFSMKVDQYIFCFVSFFLSVILSESSTCVRLLCSAVPGLSLPIESKVLAFT